MRGTRSTGAGRGESQGAYEPMQTVTVRAPAALLRVALAALAILAFVASPGRGMAQPVPASFADLAEKLIPAVVNISTAQKIEAPEGMPELPKGSPFEDLFRDFLDKNGRPAPRTVKSLGSGFVISAEGHIVTNNHVIEGADEITIIFSDGRRLDAKVLGTDKKTDLALLKVEPEEPLPFVSFGDSDAMRVGDWVLAIGNPFGFGSSVSAGIISARNRDINAGPYDDFIQTDAAINRGNSGGPLFNLKGEVIGIATAIISPTGGSIGLGFAVPSNLAKGVIDQLMKYGTTRRGWLGVRIQTVDEEMAQALGMEKAIGALVAEVTPGSPAEEAGIQIGDVIVRFDGKEVKEMRELPRIVANTEVGKTVRVVVFRKGKTQTLKVKVGLLEEKESAVAPATPNDALPERALDSLGLTLAPLSDEARAKYGLADEVTGVVVTDVDPSGPAAAKGIKPGDVVVEVGQQPVATPEDVEQRVSAARDAGRKTVLFLVQTGPDLRFVPLSVKG